MSRKEIKMVTVTCPACHRKRELSESHARRVLKDPTTICHDCYLSGVRNMSRNRDKTMAINGCVLRAAGRTGSVHSMSHRGENYLCLKCHKYESCLDAVARLDWPGWEVVNQTGGMS